MPSTPRLTIWALLTLAAVSLTSCATTVPGVAVKAQTDDPIVALMDTGAYPTAPGPPPGYAGTDRASQARAELQRMAPSVVGPWQVDTALINQDFLATAGVLDGGNLDAALSYPMIGLPGLDWADPIAKAASAHGFIAGLTTGRTGRGSTVRLHNAVLRFPDAKSAADAAAEMAAVVPPNSLELISTLPRPTAVPKFLDPAWQPGACADYSSSAVHPDVAASAAFDNTSVVRAFTAHGAYVLYQFVIADTNYNACTTMVSALSQQEPLIDQFVPTDPTKMADLPLDPSGYLSARTLWEASPNRTPWSSGMWRPEAWLHFADSDPIKAATLFKSAGVQWVSQRLTTVYQAGDAAGAARVVDLLAADARALPNVVPTQAGVPGFPTAKCLNRTDWTPIQKAIIKSNPHVWWHFTCIAQTDRYAFIAYSDNEQDAKQQISAQYRILSGH